MVAKDYKFGTVAVAENGGHRGVRVCDAAGTPTWVRVQKSGVAVFQVIWFGEVLKSGAYGISASGLTTEIKVHELTNEDYKALAKKVLDDMSKQDTWKIPGD